MLEIGVIVVGLIVGCVLAEYDIRQWREDDSE